MTFRQFVKNYCEERGMFDNQADAVVEAVINDPRNGVMQGRWDNDISSYPKSIVALLAMTIDNNALEYIERECPEAWFKPLFQKETEK